MTLPEILALVVAIILLILAAIFMLVSLPVSHSAATITSTIIITKITKIP